MTNIKRRNTRRLKVDLTCAFKPAAAALAIISSLAAPCFAQAVDKPFDQPFGGRPLAGQARDGLPIEAGVNRQQQGPVNILFLLDASYSMREKLAGSENKMNAAKEVLEQALSRIPNDVNIGLRVFGQGYSGESRIDCFQTALLVPLGTHNRVSIIQRVSTIKPFGMTPLGLALRMAAQEDLRMAEGAKTIILISDGADTCGEDPCLFIRMFPRMGIDVKIDIVGLALKRDPNARHQLNCIAETSGGKYYDANTASELINSISVSVDKAISGQVIPKIKSPGTPQSEELKALPETLP